LTGTQLCVFAAFSFAPSGLVLFAKHSTHGSRRGLHSFAASRRRPTFARMILRLGRILLAGLCGYKTLIVLTSVWNHLHVVLQRAIKSVGESGRKIHGEKIDIKLQ